MNTTGPLRCFCAAWMLLLAGCGYRYYAEPFTPASEMAAATEMEVSDDGTLTYIQGRLEIGLRPVTDEELNRQFSSHSRDGIFSANPYTYSDWVDPELGERPPRFTVFRLKVKNYMYPKMRVDPVRARVLAQNGRRYAPLSLPELEWHYQKYVTGYAGNNYAVYKERLAILRSTLYAGDVVFSGQEAEGFLVFPVLHHDVQRIRVQLCNVALRFDVWDEPVEQVDIEYVFEREIGRVYPDGGRLDGV